MRFVRIALVCMALAAVPRAQQPSFAVVATSQPGGILDQVACLQPKLTNNGRLLFFTTQGNFIPGYSGDVIVVKDLGTGTASAVVKGNRPEITPTGRFVAFDTSETLLPQDIYTGGADVYRLDRLTGTLHLVSIAMPGLSPLASSAVTGISSDGNLVVFESASQNLVPGDTVAFPSGADIFVRDIAAGTTVRVSAASDGSDGNQAASAGAIAADGRWISFGSRASNLVANDTNGLTADIFIHDLLTGSTTLVSVDSQGLQGTGDSAVSRLSADGRFIAFNSLSALAPGDQNKVLPFLGSDVYVRDLQTGITTRASSNPAGLSLLGESGRPGISADGRWVSFISGASDLVPGDTNGLNDAFLLDRQTGQLTRASVVLGGLQLNLYGPWDAALTPNGRFVCFDRQESLSEPGEHDGFPDAYVYDRGPWVNLAGAKTGAAGTPLLVGTGSLLAGTPGSLALSQLTPSAHGLLFVSLAPAPIAFKGGVLQAWPAIVTTAVMADPAGAAQVPFIWPSGMPPAMDFVLQAVFVPAAGAGAVAISNAVEATAL